MTSIQREGPDRTRGIRGIREERDRKALTGRHTGPQGPPRRPVGVKHPVAVALPDNVRTPRPSWLDLSERSGITEEVFAALSDVDRPLAHTSIVPCLDRKVASLAWGKSPSGWTPRSSLASKRFGPSTPSPAAKRRNQTSRARSSLRASQSRRRGHTSLVDRPHQPQPMERGRDAIDLVGPKTLTLNGAEPTACRDPAALR